MGRNYSDFCGDKSPRYKTGFASAGNKPTFYNAWQNMKQRCSNPKHPKYHRYGGRGIKVCDEWLNIEQFSEWAIQNKLITGMSIDRINNDGDYTPENCRVVSMSENSRKKRTTKLSLEDAKDIRMRINNGESEYDLAKEYNVVHGTVWFIVNRFTNVEEGECSRMLKQRNK